LATTTIPKAKHRAPLSRERVLGAAVRLADRDGIESVSMRRLGQELGVEAMSLYNHVAHKEDLLDGLVDVVVAEIDPPISADWRTAFRERVLAARRVLLRHPWASGAITSRKTVTPTVMAYMDSTIGILRDGGFSVDMTHHVMHVLGSRILGFAQELYDDSEALAESPEIAAMMLEQLAGSYPHLSELAQAVTHDAESTVGTGCDDQFEFEFALDLILDGLERLRDA
jgi:AcrR family transcriptional regulator